MQRRLTWAAGLALGVGLVLLTSRAADAVITRLTPLKEVLSTEQLIFTAKVEKVDPTKPAMVLTLAENLKGKAPFERLAINLTGDSEGQKEKHTPELLKRVAPDMPILFFASLRGKRYTAFGYTNGTWFQMLGYVSDEDKTVRWAFTHCEPYLRRTFKGTTAEMKQAVVDGLSGKKAPPEPNEKEPAGFGPVQPKSDAKDKDKGTGLSVGPPLGVIPTFVIMGPLALLAALFPAVFGGAAIFMRRWIVLLSVACTTSTIFTVYVVLVEYLPGWWGSDAALWTLMTLVTLLGALWSGWRCRSMQQAGQEVGLPTHGERTVLWATSVLGLAIVAWNLFDGGAAELFASPWRELLIFWVGAWAGLAYVFFLKLAPQREGEARALPIEVIVLWGMVFATANLGVLAAGGGQASGNAIEIGETPATGQTIKPQGVAWQFDAGRGSIFSSPLVAGDRVYTASIEGGLSPYGVVYCLERDTGKKLWQFDDDGDLKQVFSSPCLADGRLYLGEGLHENKGCRFYCLDAKSGKKLWQFETSSHTESSPCVADGKVFFGAGDDGLYCCDAVSGKKLWQFNSDRHIDVSPVVSGRYVFAGSGVSRTQSVTEIFCLSIEDGTPLWQVPTDLPVWGSPAVFDGLVYVGLGKGRLDASADKPAGAVLCLDAINKGRRIWRFDTPDAVLVRPAVDRHSVYFGCRDHQLYCLDRHDGRLRWKQDLGSPVVTAAVLARSSSADETLSVFAIASGGKVACLDAATGQPSWSWDLAKETGAAPVLYSSPALQIRRDGAGERRRLFFGAALKNAVTGAAARLYCLEDRVEGQ